MKQDFDKTYLELYNLNEGESLERYLCPAFDLKHMSPYETAKVNRELIDQGRYWGHLPPTDEIKFFLEKVGDIVDPKTILEIGICLGYSATYMLQTFLDCKILGVDILGFQRWGNLPPGIKLVKDKYPNRYVILECDSKEITQWLKKDTYDLALVDGWHDYDYAYHDIQSCKDLNIPWIMVDNYYSVPEVCQAIKDHDLIEVESTLYESVRSLVNGTFPQKLQMWKDQIGLFKWKP